MEGLTRLVSESLARHGFDRPLDYRRLHWSRWFRCESHHSLLIVPSKAGVFALAEEIIGLSGPNHVGTAARGCPAEQTSAGSSVSPRRMLAVAQFFEADDMAFVLDRMLARRNPMQAHLNSGRYFVRFVIIEDEIHRRSICNALNQWIANSFETASGIGSHFAASLELTPANEYDPMANAAQGNLFENQSVARAPRSAPIGDTQHSQHTGEVTARPAAPPVVVPQFDGAREAQRPSPFPSGF
jgi:hypothetical protein